MEVYADRVVGIDIGKAQVKACIRVPGRRPGSFTQQVRSFATTTVGLLGLRDWMAAERVSLAGMESTGQYWKPVYYLLESFCVCWLINPQHIKVVPGRKSDVSDSMWIAQLVQFGLVRPSFVPPPGIRRLRDLTRLRTSLIREQTRHTQRIHDVLEDAMIKIAIVATDIMGVSGRAMLAALIAGERDPQRLADLACGRLRVKTAALIDALTGRFSDHHALQLQILLHHFDDLETSIHRLDAQIDAELGAQLHTLTNATETTETVETTESVETAQTVPTQATQAGCLREVRERLDTIPGVGRRAAEVIIAETGADMTRFPTAAHLSSWAGMCPGNNESAGKHGSTRTRKANPWLRGCLGEAAHAAQKTRNTHINTRYRQIRGRRGSKRATVATGRHILESAWTIMRTPDQTYQELGPDHRVQRTRNPTRRIQYLLHQIHALGYDITATPATT
jgi:transposase